MNMIDLHVHSCHSDGTLTPSELVELAVSKNLAAFALTDHDTVNGIPEALRAAEGLSLKVIPGVELSTDYNGTEVHILGYQIDYTDIDLLRTLEDIVKERDNRNIKMCNKLCEAGYPITYEELMKEYGDHVITRAHFAKFLVGRGAIDSIDAAFRGPLNNHSPYFVTRKYLKPEEAVELIISKGGIPVLAHPLLYKLSVSEIHELCKTLCVCGLKGIEAKYSSNKGNDEAFVKKVAKEHGLFITGGSDFHGANKPHIQLGTGMGNLYVPETLLENLK